MYRPGKPEHGQRLFRPPPPHGPPFGLRSPCGVLPPGHLPSRPGGTFSTPAPDRHFLHNRPPRGHFINPHCSSFSIDRSAVIALGGRQQIVPPAEPPHTQVTQWNITPVDCHPPDNSDAGEEFLRCIAANKPLPDYLKGNMAYNLADAFKSAKVLKDAVQSDFEFQRHMTRSKSRSRSRGRSQRKCRAKSRARSKSRSRGRSKSHARGRSQARSKSRAHSRKRSRSRSKKSHVRSKSRVRRSKSRSSSGEKSRAKDKKRKRSPSLSCSSSVSSNNNQAGNSLLEGLKLVMNSKELEERLPSLKDAIFTIQASNESQNVKCERPQQHDSQEKSTSLENDSMLLPHDRVGSDFSWLQVQNQEDSAAQKANELEDEESFLYGSEVTGVKQISESSTTLFASFSQIGEHPKLQEMESLAFASQQVQNKSIFSTFEDLRDSKQPLQTSPSSLASASLDSSETETIKNILQNLGTTDITNIMVKMQGQKEEKQPSPAHPGSDISAAGLALPARSNPNVRQALESLQSLIKATKEKRVKRDDIGMPQTSSNKHKAGDDERLTEKQARISKMESLMKELEGLMKQDGLKFLTPVIGFYCQKCEEFIGDLISAENHAAIHRHCNCGSKTEMDKHAGDKGHSNHFSSSSKPHPHPSDKRDHRDYSTRKDSTGVYRSHRDYQRDWRDERDQTRTFDDHRSHRAGQENISLKEEMKKERMLITVSHGLTPPPHIRVKEMVNKEQAVGSNGKVKLEDGKVQPSIDGKDKDESSDAKKGKAPKTKSLKKKKKEKKKKEKRDTS